jgi:hypothetical protein
MRPDRELGFDCVARIDDRHSLMVAHGAREVIAMKQLPLLA